MVATGRSVRSRIRIRASTSNMTSVYRKKESGRLPPEADAVTLSRELARAEKEVREACGVLDAEPESNSAEFRRAKGLGRVVGKFFSKTERTCFPELVTPLRSQREYVLEVVALEETMAVFRRNVVAIRQAEDRNYVDGKIRDSAAGVVRQMKRVIEVYSQILLDCGEGEVWERARGIAGEVADELAGYDLVYAESAEKTSVGLGGTTGSMALGMFFTDRAASERKTADQLRAGVIFLLVLIAAVAAWILFLSPLDSDTLGREFARLSTTVPLAVLAGYLGRESSRHRNTADRSEEFGAHLKHLDGYVSQLSEEERRRYRYELGQSAYVMDKHSVGDVNSSGLVEEVARLVEAVKGLASR